MFCRIHMPSRACGTVLAPGVLIIPGFADTAVGPHNMHVQLARRLVQSGYAVARFDYRGLGESEGDFRRFTLNSGREDVLSALDALCRQEGVDVRRLGIVGYSLGGAYAAQAAADHSAVRAVGLLAPVACPASVLPTFFKPEHRRQLEREGWIDWSGWAVGSAFMNSLHELDPVEAMARSGVPALVIHGTNDVEVPVDSAYQFRAKGAELCLIEGADHPFSAMRFKDIIFAKICDWFASKL